MARGLKKGQCNNRQGRPKGSTGKKNKELRATITLFLENNFSTVITGFNKLDPKDRAKIYCDLLQYAVPKLSAISTEVKFDNLSDEQLDTIINKLTNQK